MIKFKQFLDEGTYAMPSLSFKSFLNEAKNLHLEHAEDLIFDLGVEGARKAIFFLRDVRDMLTMGSAPSKTVASVKWDGCLHEDTVLWTNHGKMTIKQLVEHPEIWDTTYVMGKDVDAEIPTNKLTRVIGGSKTNSNKNWVEVVLETGDTLRLTEDHEVHTNNRGWVAAKELNENDDITEF